MSGNLWMFSDMLDDEDVEMLKRDFITYYQGADYYGLGLKMFTRMAHEAGAVYKIGKKVLIRRSLFDEYLRQQCKSNDRENRLSLYDESDEDIVIEEIGGRDDETRRTGTRLRKRADRYPFRSGGILWWIALWDNHGCQYKWRMGTHTN